jgi:hypothetical protein
LGSTQVNVYMLRFFVGPRLAREPYLINSWYSG